MNTIGRFPGFVSFSVDANKKYVNNRCSAKKTYSTFQKSKYLQMISSAETNAQLQNIQSLLKKEASKAEKCQDAKTAMIKIKSTMNKVKEKTSDLKLEKAMKNKNEKLRSMHKKKEALKNEKKLRNRKDVRKNKELNNVINALKEEKNENSIGGCTNTFGIQDSNINAIAAYNNFDENTVSETEGAVDTTV